jgi:hypothetical protein
MTGVTHTYKLTLDSFDIKNTRARHEDTDYVSLSVAVVSSGDRKQYPTQKKFLGNVNNGHHLIQLHVDNIELKPDAKLIMNYIMINNGHGKHNPNQVLEKLESSSSTLVNKGADAAAAGAGALIGTSVLPGLGTAIGLAAGWIVHEIGAAVFADCDGPVAVEQAVLSAADLEQKTQQGAFKHKTHHPGTDSPTGCGSNSEYDVTWTISRTA